MRVPTPRDHLTTATTEEDAEDAATVRSEPESSAEPVSPAGVAAAARYRPDAILGVGGMGEVRLCRDEIIGRDVARKQMLPEVRDSGRARSRFTREALVQARLEHPSIVPVYDVGLADPEGPWFTMKRIRGRSLESVLEAAQDGTGVGLTRRRLLTAFVQVCFAVDYAHGRGVIHRDLKPGNVMLGEFGEVHVLDWGLAKVVGESHGERPLELSSSDADMTLAGSLMGTPGYMAPEQALGAVDEIGARADVYALGAILFEILTGERLHGETSAIVLLTATMSGVEPARFEREEIPPELAEVCSRATATRPEDRLASARELADAVERYLDGDRDLELRARLAAEHVERARHRIGAGAPASEAARAEALRELGRAVALDPSNAEALDRMTHLLVAPTQELPAEVAPVLLQARYAERRAAFAAAARRFLLWCMFIPAMFSMGVLHLPVVAGISVCTAAAALVAWLGSRAERPRVWHGVLMLSASSMAVALSTGVLGVYVIAPVLAATNTIFFAMHAPRKYRTIVVITGVVSILVPFVVEVTGTVPPAYSFPAEGGLYIAERATRFPPLLTHVFVLAINALVVIVPTLMVVRTREALARAERALQVQAWRLRQMLPGETRDLLTVSPASSAPSPREPTAA